MSIAVISTFVTLTIAQLVLWETRGFAASLSVMRLLTSLSLILQAYLAAAHTVRPGLNRWSRAQPNIRDINYAAS